MFIAQTYDIDAAVVAEHQTSGEGDATRIRTAMQTLLATTLACAWTQRERLWQTVQRFTVPTLPAIEGREWPHTIDALAERVRIAPTAIHRVAEHELTQLDLRLLEALTNLRPDQFPSEQDLGPNFPTLEERSQWRLR